MALHAPHAGETSPSSASLGTWILLGVAQAAIGYIQYFNEVPALLVGIHVAGATAVMWASTVLLLDTRRVAANGRASLERGVGSHLECRPMTQPVGGTQHRAARRRRVVQLLLGLLVTLGALLGAQTAHAQDDVAIQVQVKDQQRDASGKANNQPVPGVSVTVLDASGAEIATAVTDDKGVALIPVPGKADYTVQVDEDSLPDGLELSAETPAEQLILGDSFRTSKRIVNLFTGKSQSAELGDLERISQRFADGIRLGLIIAMCSVGLSLIFGTTGLTNFAHGEMVTFGAMAAYASTTPACTSCSPHRWRWPPAGSSGTPSTSSASRGSANAASV